MAEEVFNLYDHAKLFGPDGKLAAVAKVLDQNNVILHDALTIESNSDDGHHFAVQNGVSKVVWRRAYEGVKPTKGSTTMVKKTYGRASAVSEVDVAVAEKGGKVSEVRAAMASEKLDRMAEEQAHKIIYGSLKEDERTFEGFAANYSSLDPKVPASRQVVDFTKETSVAAAQTVSATSNSSIYFIGWGKDKIYTFYPKGTQAGIKVYDYSKNGPIDLKDADGGTYPGYKEQYEMLMGMAVQDWRYGARLCNINVAAVATDKQAKIDLYEAFMKTLGLIKNINNCKLVCYASRQVKDLLRSGYMAAGGVTVFQNNNMTSSGNQGYGAADLVIDGIHIKAEDAIHHKEAEVESLGDSEGDSGSDSGSDSEGDNDGE